MSIKVPCQFNCEKEVISVCMICEQIFCLEHGQYHQNEFHHSVELANNETKIKIHQNRMNLKIVKNKRIDETIQIINYIISNLQQRAQKQIMSVKRAKNINEIMTANFELEMHLLDFAKTGMINEGFYYISKENFYEVTENWNQITKYNENMHEKIQNLELNKIKIEEEYNQMIITCCEFQERIKKLEGTQSQENRPKTDNRLKTEKVAQGKNQKDFNRMIISQKMQDVRQNWNFINPSFYTQELLLSYDGKYVFECNFESGYFQADCNLLRRAYATLKSVTINKKVFYLKFVILIKLVINIEVRNL